MSLFIEDEVNYSFEFDVFEIGNQIIATVLELEKCPYKVEVNLLLTDDDNIHEINKTYRGIDQPTDVLSFPMIEFDKPADFSSFKMNFDSLFNQDSKELVLGDIVISVETILRQATKYNHSVKREFAFLMAHSMLHLLGYNHVEHAERLVMEEKQKEVLESVNIKRC